MTRSDAVPIKAVLPSFFLGLLPILALGIPIPVYIDWIFGGTLRRDADVLAWIAETRPLTDSVQGLLSHRAFLPKNAWISEGIGPVQALEHLDVAAGIYGITAAFLVVGIRWLSEHHRKQRNRDLGTISGRTRMTPETLAWLTGFLPGSLIVWGFADNLAFLGIDPSGFLWREGSVESVLTISGIVLLSAVGTAFAAVVHVKRKTAAGSEGLAGKSTVTKEPESSRGLVLGRLFRLAMAGRLLNWVPAALFGYLCVVSSPILSTSHHVMTADDYLRLLMLATLSSVAWPAVFVLNVFSGVFARNIGVSPPRPAVQRDAPPKT